MPGKIFYFYNAQDTYKILTELKKKNYQIITPTSKTDVTKILSSQKFDAIILSLDEMDREQIFRWFEEESSREIIPVIFITERPVIEEAIYVMKIGALDYLFPPISPEKIILLLENSNATKTKILRESNNAHSAEKKAVLLDEGIIIGNNQAIQKILLQAENVAKSDVPVLITGESGTGKELLARFIHEKSQRAGQAFVAINCAALPESLLESELFGYEKGAFSGATNRKLGKFELANGGTLLLDEISEMHLNLQAKLLRAIQEKEIDRLGGTKPVKVDVRIIATSNRNLEEEIKKGTFRADLYYRLNVIHFRLPPLRERPDDIPLLLQHYLQVFAHKYNKLGIRFANDVIEGLTRLRWEGNIRELRNVVERAVLLDMDGVITRDDVLGDEISPEKVADDNKNVNVNQSEIKPLSEVEEELIRRALEKTGGNRTHAAKLLGISVRTLRNKLAEYRQKWGISL